MARQSPIYHRQNKQVWQKSMAVLNKRARNVLYHLVDTYLETQAPVGSLTLAKRLGMNLSSATIRNTMADLEALSLVTSPHTSAGRLPTAHGLKLVVNTLLEVTDLPEIEQEQLEKHVQNTTKNLQTLCEEATQALSGLSACAGVIMAPKQETGLKHIEFVPLKPGRALVVLVTLEGHVENRLMEISESVMPFHLKAATNYINAHLHGKTLSDIKDLTQQAFQKEKATLDRISQKLIQKGLAVWDDEKQKGSLIIKGAANLVKDMADVKALDELEKILHALDTQEGLLTLVESALQADSVQIFIGSDNALFESNKCATIFAPYKSGQGVLGAIGIIGPTYMNYRRLIPMVDYTARLLSRILS